MSLVEVSDEGLLDCTVPSLDNGDGAIGFSSTSTESDLAVTVRA